MDKFQQTVDAIKSGKTVMSCGNKVVAEDIAYSWQEPKLRVQLTNGASYPLDGRELSNAEIIN